jgi:hypothetical protein
MDEFSFRIFSETYPVHEMRVVVITRIGHVINVIGMKAVEFGHCRNGLAKYSSDPGRLGIPF